MPNIQAFRGLRYNLGHVGELESVLALAPRFVDAEIQNLFYKKHPCNYVRLNCNREEPGDIEGDRLDRATRYFRNWQREGVFERDGEAAIYVVQVEDDDGGSSPTTGFISIADIESLRKSNDDASPSADDAEFQLIKRCEANLNPVTVLVEDFDARIESLLIAQVANKAPVQSEMNGLKFKLWIENDLHFISALSALAASVDHKVVSGMESLVAASKYQETHRGLPGEVIPQTDSVLSCFICLAGLRLAELSEDERSETLSDSIPRFIEYAEGLVQIPLIPSGLVVNVFD